MPIPEPEIGLVIRYAYLWRSEADRGLEEGQKDRPCAVVLAHHRRESGETIVVVAPITHRSPAGDPNAIEIPFSVKRRLGLDDERSWIITNDVNSFIWPGPDLRKVDRPEMGGEFAYGFLPRNMISEMIARIVNQMRAGTLKSVKRTK
ncbi:MAG: hypothetical protein HC850_04700 [Rhodomicrobium sp.]|nr:hypothetical protein [Rhodomicrobium sp.]